MGRVVVIDSDDEFEFLQPCESMDAGKKSWFGSYALRADHCRRDAVFMLKVAQAVHRLGECNGHMPKCKVFMGTITRKTCPFHWPGIKGPPGSSKRRSMEIGRSPDVAPGVAKTGPIVIHAENTEAIKLSHCKGQDPGRGNLPRACDLLFVDQQLRSGRSCRSPCTPADTERAPAILYILP